MRSDLTADQRVVLRKGKALARRHARMLARVDEIEEARTDVYEQGRAIDPPVTYQALADLFGVTTQSVIQKLNRRKAQRHREAQSAEVA